MTVFREITLRYPEPDNQRVAAKLYAAVLDAIEVCEKAIVALDGAPATVEITSRLYAPQGPRAAKAKAEAPAPLTASQDMHVDGPDEATHAHGRRAA